MRRVAPVEEGRSTEKMAGLLVILLFLLCFLNMYLVFKVMRNMMMIMIMMTKTMDDDDRDVDVDDHDDDPLPL